MRKNISTIGGMLVILMIIFLYSSCTTVSESMASSISLGWIVFLAIGGFVTIIISVMMRRPREDEDS